MVADIVLKAGRLSNWTREFAQGTLPVCANPSVKSVRQAIATHLPEKLAEVSSVANAKELLEEVLGIAVVVEYGREKIGWTATTDPLEAEELQHHYSNELYSKLRHELGIDGYWIFLPEPQFLDHYFSEDLYESAPEPIEMYEKFPELLRLEDRQECVIVKL